MNSNDDLQRISSRLNTARQYKEKRVFDSNCFGKLISFRAVMMLIFVIWVVGALIALLAPLDIIASNAFARLFVSMTSSVFNPSGLLGKKSDFPEVSIFYFSVVWLSFPLWFMLAWRWAKQMVGNPKSKGGIVFKVRLSIFDRLLIIAFTPLWILIAHSAYFFNLGQNIWLLDFGTSRLHLGLFGIIVPAGVGFLLACAIFGVCRSLSFGGK